MAVVAHYLVDTSAAARMHHERVAERVAPLITAGLVATCAPLDFEALFSARGPQDYEQIRADRQAAYEYLPVLDEHWRRHVRATRSSNTLGTISCAIGSANTGDPKATVGRRWQAPTGDVDKRKDLHR